MKVEVIAAENSAPEFTPYSLTVTAENAHDAAVLIALGRMDVDIPNVMRSHLNPSQRESLGNFQSGVREQHYKLEKELAAAKAETEWVVARRKGV